MRKPGFNFSIVHARYIDINMACCHTNECILIVAHCFIPKNNGSLQTDLPPGPLPKRYSIPDHIKPEVKPNRIEVGVAYMSAWRSNLL